jgi:hypothetical protein
MDFLMDTVSNTRSPAQAEDVHAREGKNRTIRVRRDTSYPVTTQSAGNALVGRRTGTNQTDQTNERPNQADRTTETLLLLLLGIENVIRPVELSDIHWDFFFHRGITQ